MQSAAGYSKFFLPVVVLGIVIAFLYFNGSLEKRDTQGVRLEPQPVENNDSDGSSDGDHGGQEFAVIDNGHKLATLRLAYDVGAEIVLTTNDEIYVVETIYGRYTGELYFISRSTGSIGRLHSTGTYVETLPDNRLVFWTSNENKRNVLSLQSYGYTPLRLAQEVTLPASCATFLYAEHHGKALDVHCLVSSNRGTDIGEDYLLDLETLELDLVQRISAPTPEGPGQPFQEGYEVLETK